jgi:hypothetical protein
MLLSLDITGTWSEPGSREILCSREVYPYTIYHDKVLALHCLPLHLVHIYNLLLSFCANPRCDIQQETQLVALPVTLQVKACHED